MDLKTSLPKTAFAGFWLRFCAYFLDCIILIPVNGALRFAASAWMPRDPSLGIFVSFLFSVFYFGPLQAYLEGSPGKRLLGLALVTEKGQTLTLGQSLARFAWWLVCALPLYAGQIAAGFSDYKQGWHDRRVHTVVVRQDHLNSFRDKGGNADPGEPPVHTGLAA